MILPSDWEFWYEAKLNLEKVLKFLANYVNEKLVDADVENIVRSRVEELIAGEPKTKDWQERSRAGPEVVARHRGPNTLTTIRPKFVEEDS